MTRLAGSRERKLLKWSEPIVRGLSSAIPIVDGASEEESDEPRSSSNVTDEAMFLPTQVPTCLWTLPLHFRTAYVSSAPTQHDNSIERQRATNASNAFDVLYACIFPICTQARMRSCSMNRALDPLLLDRVNVLHDQIFLDYLPLLRCMAALERDAESAFRAIEEADPDAATDMSNRRRSTRCSRKLGREHYFEKVVPPFALRECGRTAKQVGELLASSLLVTCG
jgi:hypothetical protein